MNTSQSSGLNGDSLAHYVSIVSLGLDGDAPVIVQGYNGILIRHPV